MTAIDGHHINICVVEVTVHVFQVQHYDSINEGGACSRACCVVCYAILLSQDPCDQSEVYQRRTDPPVGVLFAARTQFGNCGRHRGMVDLSIASDIVGAGVRHASHMD